MMAKVMIKLSLTAENTMEAGESMVDLFCRQAAREYGVRIPGI